MSGVGGARPLCSERSGSGRSGQGRTVAARRSGREHREAERARGTTLGASNGRKGDPAGCGALGAVMARLRWKEETGAACNVSTTHERVCVRSPGQRPAPAPSPVFRSANPRGNARSSRTVVFLCPFLRRRGRSRRCRRAPSNPSRAGVGPCLLPQNPRERPPSSPSTLNCTRQRTAPAARAGPCFLLRQQARNVSLG